MVKILSAGLKPGVGWKNSDCPDRTSSFFSNSDRGILQRRSSCLSSYSRENCCWTECINPKRIYAQSSIGRVIFYLAAEACFEATKPIRTNIPTQIPAVVGRLQAAPGDRKRRLYDSSAEKQMGFVCRRRVLGTFPSPSPCSELKASSQLCCGC